MTVLDRIYQIDSMLSNRPFVSKAELLDRLGISWATLKRDLAYLRDRLNAPIVFDRDLNGYRLEKQVPVAGRQYELPGLWFSAEEIHALLTMQHLLANLECDDDEEHAEEKPPQRPVSRRSKSRDRNYSIAKPKSSREYHTKTPSKR